MALSSPYRRVSARKYWFELKTIGRKIAPIQHILPGRMNEELRTASELARDPNSVSWAQWLIIGVLATWGGIVRVVREVRLGDKNWRQIIGILVAEALISSFAGVMVFLICESHHVDKFYTAALSGLAGYMGGRALNALEALIYRMRGGPG